RRVDGQMDIEAVTFTIIGVMPREFHYPTADAEFWVTTRFRPDDLVPAIERSNNWLNGIARLRPGVTREQAQAEASVVFANLRARFPKENKDRGARVVALRDDL